MAVLVVILTCAALLPWLLHRPAAAKLWPAALAALVAGLVASPQVIALMEQTRSGGATSPLRSLATSYVVSGVHLNDMFALSPKLKILGFGGLGIVYHGPTGDGIQTFGVALTVLAAGGLVLVRRRRGAWLLALLWLGCAVLALGSALKIGTHIFTPAAQELNGQRVSAVMPYTWFVRLPLLSGFREASRIMMLGIVPASLLAGAAVDWLRYHAARAIIVVAALGLLEAGWSGNSAVGTMPTALPDVDRPIAADHSDSVVVDVPYGIRGGTNFTGSGFDPDAQVLATADGHPRAVGFISRVPAPTVAGITGHAFYAGLMAIQDWKRNTPAELAAARLDARRLNIGWVLVWSTGGQTTPAIVKYLRETGFQFDYQADGVRVYRPALPGLQSWPACATLAGMSTDSRPSAADTRQASLVPGKPSLDGIEEKWSRRWEEASVVHV
jgi:hypothetical protein